MMRPVSPDISASEARHAMDNITKGEHKLNYEKKKFRKIKIYLYREL